MTNDIETNIQGTNDFFQTIPLASCIVDTHKGIYLANQALASIFGYDSIQNANQSLQDKKFLSEHFTARDLYDLQKELTDQGYIQSKPICARTLDGKEIDLKITARATWPQSLSTPEQLTAYFVQTVDDDHSELFEIKAQAEARLAKQAKDEFLSNISHELMTPLNIVLGMLSLVLEDESIGPKLSEDLTLAKDAADGLFVILNDLITLSFLAARKITPDITPFSPTSMLVSMRHQFAAQARAKGVTITTETNSLENDLLEGGYNFITQALVKVICNAIKVSKTGGQVDIETRLSGNEDDIRLQCIVSDSGPGLADNFIRDQELFCQGDGSTNRKQGGLGLGLHLAVNLAKYLGGKLTLTNRPEGGAKISLEVPVKKIILEDY